MQKLLISLLAACLATAAMAQPGKKNAPKLAPPLLEPNFDKLPPPEPVKPPEKVAPKVTEKAPAADDAKPYAVFMVAPPPSTKPTQGEVGIGFFNHSKREVVLEVNNRTIKLGVGYYVQLKLPREFNWREKDGKDFSTKIPADFDGAEIVFRK